jgi:hypothetical protein
VKRWTRWHSDDWTGVVVQTDAGEWFYGVSQGAGDPVLKPAAGRADAQHRAEEIVRNSGHRCTARCSFWVSDLPEEE